MGFQKIPSRWYSACSDSMMLKLKYRCRVSFVKLMQNCSKLLYSKHSNPNTSKIPIHVMAGSLSRSSIVISFSSSGSGSPCAAFFFFLLPRRTGGGGLSFAFCSNIANFPTFFFFFGFGFFVTAASAALSFSSFISSSLWSCAARSFSSAAAFSFSFAAFLLASSLDRNSSWLILSTTQSNRLPYIAFDVESRLLSAASTLYSFQITFPATLIDCFVNLLSKSASFTSSKRAAHCT
mmetsp:Transcript_1507/g.2837  ORF Transcript_1507/g.2837 Transcript_1507/m.2837 type:complete len:236 (-) Transcript_1507:1119-1826(-)